MRTSSPSLAGEPVAAALARAALGALLLLAAPRGAGATPLEIDRGDAGWTVRATGARVEDVLGALAEREPFAVAMQLGVERPLVDVDLRDASLEEVLRDVLRGRNYTIAYREDGDRLAVSRVELLLPRQPRDADEPGVARRADLSVEDAARVAARQQRMREQQMFARLRSANAAARPAARAAVRPQAVPGRAVAVASEPLPLHRQLWNRIFSGTAPEVR